MEPLINPAGKPPNSENVNWDEPLTIFVPPKESLEPSPMNAPDAVTSPVILKEPVNCDEPLTSNSPTITEAVTTPSICLLCISVAIIYSLFYLLLKNLYLQLNQDLMLYFQ